MITCGHCKGQHPAIEEVRLCSQVHYAEKVFSEPEPELTVNEKNMRLDILIPPGRYAVEMDGQLKFFKLDRPTEGHWAGKTFVQMQVSDEYYTVQSRRSKERIFEAILRNPKKAMLMYGKMIGRCGHCGRTLTNLDSIERGIGPICASTMGWRA